MTAHQALTTEVEHVHTRPEARVPRLTVLPFRHTKVLHLIRHGEGFHNVAGRKNHELYKSFDYEDAHLTEEGWRQAHQVNHHIRASGLKVDVVIVSPLTRALETAVGCFGNLAAAAPDIPQEPAAASSASSSNGSKRLPLMRAITAVPGKRAAHPAVSSEGCPPMVVHELCREHLGVHPCDRRLRISDKVPLFPAIDFSAISEDEDPLWTLDTRETKAAIMARGRAFLEQVLARPEHSIAVVSHSSFLHFMLANFGGEEAPEVQGELHKWFENCELRSVVVSDHGQLPRKADPYAYAGFASHVPEGPEA